MAKKSKANIALQSLEQLRTRLIDLTSRNRLINFPHTKGSCMRIIDELPDQLADTLLNENDMRFIPVPEPTRDELIEAGYIEINKETGQEQKIQKDPSAEEWAKHLGLDTSYEMPVKQKGQSKKHRDNAIQMLMFPYELETRLRSMRQKANTVIEENGINILYLAFGFLEWYDEDSNGKSRLAPLYLIPVLIQKGRLNNNTGTYEYTIGYSGEDILPNYSLREKLKRDFNIAMPNFNENTTPENYLKSMQNLIKKNKPDWKVKRFITLALLNFSKLLMYLDLDPDRWPAKQSIIKHPIASTLLGAGAVDREEPAGFEGEYDIDMVEDIHDKYPLIEDADSSQHSALITALEGKNLVIEGPPGTGKSQTITNIIAAAISQGKKVLFVAEKLAALEVVKSRLDRANLGSFCLELHSHKTQKRKMLDDLQARLDMRGCCVMPDNVDELIARHEELKKDLISYTTTINQKWKNTGKTLHETLMAAARYREELLVDPEAVHPVGLDGEIFDESFRIKSKDQVNVFCNSYRTVVGQLPDCNEMQGHPWYGVNNSELQFFDASRVQGALNQWQECLHNIINLRLEIAETFDIKEIEVAADMDMLRTLLTDLQSLPELKGDEVMAPLTLLTVSSSSTNPQVVSN